MRPARVMTNGIKPAYLALGRSLRLPPPPPDPSPTRAAGLIHRDQPRSSSAPPFSSGARGESSQAPSILLCTRVEPVTVSPRPVRRADLPWMITKHAEPLGTSTSLPPLASQ